MVGKCFGRFTQKRYRCGKAAGSIEEAGDAEHTGDEADVSDIAGISGSFLVSIVVHTRLRPLRRSRQREGKEQSLLIVRLQNLSNCVKWKRREVDRAIPVTTFSWRRVEARMNRVLWRFLRLRRQDATGSSTSAIVSSTAISSLTSSLTTTPPVSVIAFQHPEG